MTFEVDSSVSAIGAYNHLKFCHNNFKQEGASLWENLDVNGDVLFSPKGLLKTKETIFDILKQQKSDLTEENFFKTLNLESFVVLIHQVCVGFFSLQQKSTKPLVQVMDYICSLIVKSCIARLDSGLDSLIVHSLLKFLVNAAEALQTYNLVDLRVDLTLKLLLNIYKKLFFNQITTILANMLAMLKNETAERSFEEMGTFSLFIDFYKELRNFVFELVPLRPIKHFCMTTIDFKRKLFYYFFGFFRQIIEKESIAFSYTSLLSMLNGIFYLVKENSKLIQDFIITFGDTDKALSMMLEFKKKFFLLGDSILQKVYQHVRKFVIEKMSGINSQNFDIDQIIKKNLIDIYKPLEKTHSYYKIKIIKVIFVAVLEQFIIIVSNEGAEFILNGGFSESIEKMKEFFSISYDNQGFENFIKFLEYFQQFIRSKKQEVCEIGIAMMKTILSEEISNEFIHKIIRSKDYTETRFKIRQMINYFKDLMEYQRAGEAVIQKKQNARKQLGCKLLLGSNCFKFVRIMKRKLITKKVNEIRFEEETPETKTPNIKNTLLAEKLDTFKKTVNALFVKNSDYENMSDENILESLKSVLLKNPPSEYTFAYETEKIVVFNQIKKLVKIFHPGKFIKIEKIDIAGFKSIVLTYRNVEKVIITTGNVDSQEKLFAKLEKIIQVFKEQLFNVKRLFKKSGHRRCCAKSVSNQKSENNALQIEVRT